LSKVGRAGARSSSKGAKASAQRKSKSKSRESGTKTANWVAAQFRAARHRVGAALRLGAIAAAALFGVILSLYAFTGGLDDARAELARSADRQLTLAGFTVDWVDVSGANRLSNDHVAALIGAEPGASLAGFDLEAARQALEADPWIASARLHRMWPNRLAVVIEERQPFALWQENGVHRVIDPTGTVIASADPTDFADLPRVVGEGANVNAGEMVSLLLRHDDIARRVSHLIFVGERRWSLRLVSGGEVLLPQSDPEGALSLLGRMHADRGVLDYDAQILDLRNEGEMVMRPWPDRAAQAAGRGA
jgi:cell division protein FtsQ